MTQKNKGTKRQLQQTSKWKKGHYKKNERRQHKL
jgi:hypothetical protein